MKKIELKPPLTYYGGKQLMLKNLLPLVPEHRIYDEPYFGGGALFFAKPHSKIEFINDISGEIVNFYKVIKRDFENLKSVVDCTLHSEFQHKEAREIYFRNVDANEVARAWAVFVLSHQSMFSNLGHTWKLSKDRNVAKQFQTKKEMFNKVYVKRLENTSIFCRDAVKVIKATDSGETFHYVDPPYINTDCGHYSGYTEQNYETLLETLQESKGMFLLSSFPTDILSKFVKKNKWLSVELDLSKSTGFGKRKIEVLTMNYRPSDESMKEAFLVE